MSDQFLDDPSFASRNSDTFPRTAKFFNWLGYVVARTEGLLWASKKLIFGTGFLLFLIYELAHFAKYLIKNWQ